MTASLDPMLLNLIYAALGGILMIVFNWAAARLFRHIMGFSVREELKNGNKAVGLVMMGIFIGLGVGLGLVIGLSMN